MLAYLQCVFRMKVYEPKDGSCSQSRGPYSKALVSSLVSSVCCWQRNQSEEASRGVTNQSGGSQMGVGSFLSVP